MLGTQVSHYRLERALGAGTYGRVYAAVHIHDPELRAAVKVVHASLATDPEFVASLKRECRVLSRLQHSHLVGFRELVLSDDHPPALVLEYLEGEDLAERSARGPLAPEEAVRIGRELLAGLAYAHSKGVVHRDIKPSNLFLTTDGDVKLLDFGLAKAADGSRATQTGQIQGTLDYMASELFDGVPASPSTDVYAAGLVLWELLAGGPACPAGSMMKKIGWHGRVGAPSVQTVAPAVPAALASVVSLLTAREGRPADGGAALEALRAVGIPEPSVRAAHRPETVTLATGSLPPSSPPPSDPPMVVAPPPPPQPGPSTPAPSTPEPAAAGTRTAATAALLLIVTSGIGYIAFQGSVSVNSAAAAADLTRSALYNAIGTDPGLVTSIGGLGGDESLLREQYLDYSESNDSERARRALAFAGALRREWRSIKPGGGRYLRAQQSVERVLKAQSDYERAVTLWATATQQPLGALATSVGLARTPSPDALLPIE